MLFSERACVQVAPLPFRGGWREVPPRRSRRCRRGGFIFRVFLMTLVDAESFFLCPHLFMWEYCAKRESVATEKNEAHQCNVVSDGAFNPSRRVALSLSDSLVRYTPVSALLL